MWPIEVVTIALKVASQLLTLLQWQLDHLSPEEAAKRALRDSQPWDIIAAWFAKILPQ